MSSIRTNSLTAVLVLPLLVLTGCPKDREDPLTLGEATSALEQASDAGMRRDAGRRRDAGVRRDAGRDSGPPDAGPVASCVGPARNA